MKDLKAGRQNKVETYGRGNLSKRDVAARGFQARAAAAKAKGGKTLDAK